MHGRMAIFGGLWPSMRFREDSFPQLSRLLFFWRRQKLQSKAKDEIRGEHQQSDSNLVPFFAKEFVNLIYCTSIKAFFLGFHLELKSSRKVFILFFIKEHVFSS